MVCLFALILLIALKPSGHDRDGRDGRRAKESFICNETIDYNVYEKYRIDQELRDQKRTLQQDRLLDIYNNQNNLEDYTTKCNNQTIKKSSENSSNTTDCPCAKRTTCGKFCDTGKVVPVSLCQKPQQLQETPISDEPDTIIHESCYDEGNQQLGWVFVDPINKCMSGVDLSTCANENGSTYKKIEKEFDPFMTEPTFDLSNYPFEVDYEKTVTHHYENDSPALQDTTKRVLRMEEVMKKMVKDMKSDTSNIQTSLFQALRRNKSPF